ncbi:MAG TPA: hypothetical protein VL418_05225 [Devosiaceae bacterium]|nr:hypothetical protein [Devosiaceae bacterium]
MNRILTAAALVAMAALSTAPALAATTTAAKPAATTAVAKPVAKPVAKVAVAKPEAGKPTVVTFKMIDANHDGKISFVELKKYWPTLTKAQFAKFSGKDGSMSRAQLAAFAKSVAPAKTAKK